jgi:hypothetical protein
MERMFRRRQAILLAATLALLSCVTAIKAQVISTPTPTDLCAIMAHPADWDNKLISVSASYYEAAWPGGPVLADDHCDAGVVNVAFARHTDIDKRLTTSIPETSLGTFDHSVNAAWIGRFHAKYGKFHETFFEVERIANFKVAAIDFSESDASPISASIEEVVTHPRVFNHKTIAFRSRFESDGMHASLLFECGAGNIGRAIRIMSTEGAKGLNVLDDALYRGGPGTSDKTIQADWIGRVSWSPRAKPLESGYQIQIISVQNLVVKMHATEPILTGEAEAHSRPSEP